MEGSQREVKTKQTNNLINAKQILNTLGSQKCLKNNRSSRL